MFKNDTDSIWSKKKSAIRDKINLAASESQPG